MPHYLHTAIAVAAAGLLTPVILAALKKHFPATEARDDELEILAARYDGLEKRTFVSMLIGFFAGVIVVLQKKIEVDTLLLILGSPAVMVAVSMLASVALNRDREAFFGFMRFQEVKYKISARFTFGIAWFLCALGIIGAVSFFAR